MSINKRVIGTHLFHSFTYCFWLHLHHRGRIEQRLHDLLKSKIFTVWSFVGKASWPGLGHSLVLAFDVGLEDRDGVEGLPGGGENSGEIWRNGWALFSLLPASALRQRKCPISHCDSDECPLGARQQWFFPPLHCLDAGSFSCFLIVVNPSCRMLFLCQRHKISLLRQCLAHKYVCV